jgi:phosphatidylinositol-3-phosphatase
VHAVSSRHARRRPAVLYVLLVALFGVLPASSIGSFAQAPSSCGRAPKHPATYRHVLVLVLENRGFSQVAGSSPYLNRLARSCGLADRYSAVAHPSLPNYLAMTSGSTDGISSDCTSCSTSARSIFEQLGANWRSYLESMPVPGYRGAEYGEYAKKHNPAAYYARIAKDYATNAVPLESRSVGLLHDLRENSLSRFSLIVPNVCHDEHDCQMATGDAWLRRWVPRILQSGAYAQGTTVLFITYDEGTALDNRVYMVIVSPSTPAGRVVSTAFSHYSLLRTVEGLLGLHCLAHACDRSTVSMRADFGL